jgi:ADP-ribosylglycohydrolase
MRQFEWNKGDSFSDLYICSLKEARILLDKIYDTYDINHSSFEGDYYFLYSSREHTFSLLPSLNYAFDYDDQPYHGLEKKADEAALIMARYIPFEKMELKTEKALMGMLVADYVGSRYEYRTLAKIPTIYELADNLGSFTDETILMIATAAGIERAIEACPQGLLASKETRAQLSHSVYQSLRYYGSLFSYIHYEPQFYRWLISASPKPYAFDSNDGMARVVYAGYIAKSIEEANEIAGIACAVTHENEDTIKAAETLAGLVFILLQENNKEKALEYLLKQYPDMNDILSGASFYNNSSKIALILAFTAFYEAENYPQTIVNAIAKSKNVDSVCSVAGALAQCIYTIPKYLQRKVLAKLPDSLAKGLYQSIYGNGYKG